jgi:hypothetical protein
LLLCHPKTEPLRDYSVKIWCIKWAPSNLTLLSIKQAEIWIRINTRDVRSQEKNHEKAQWEAVVYKLWKETSGETK